MSNELALTEAEELWTKLMEERLNEEFGGGWEFVGKSELAGSKIIINEEKEDV